MSFPEQAFDLDQIFVGRHHELRILSKLWKKALEPGEHLVYVMLNAPGTGKTRLLQHFGQQLERENQGLYFRYRCSSRFTTTTELHVDLLKNLYLLLTQKADLIQQYIVTCYKKPLHDELIEDLQQIRRQMKDLVKTKQEASLSETVSFIQDVSAIIPILFVADEIQDFQKSVLKVEEPSLLTQDVSEETALHYFTRILKDLMQVPILMILSGTQYHILSQIGTKIGSPIAQKVQQLLIKNFTTEEIQEYVDEVYRNFVTTTTPQEKEPNVMKIIEHYRWFLRAFSGGHPRTVVLITQWFLINLPSFIEKAPDRDEFTDILFTQVEKDFKNRILTSRKQEHIKQLQSKEGFPIVKNWLLNKVTSGLSLGAEPQIDDPLREQVEDLLYQLTTLGIIVKNGWNQYHVTSYFHLLAFLECFTDDYEVFLQQVLKNRFFKLLCGSHAGFGYVFEHVLLAAFFLKSYKVTPQNTRPPHHDSSPPRNIQFSLDHITAIQEIPRNVNWKDLSLEPHILYHTPYMAALDLLVLEAQQLVLVQVTTAARSHRDKMAALARAVEEASSAFLDKNVMGWYISLFPVPESEVNKWSDSMIITSGEALTAILGDALLQRLLNVKKQLNLH